MKWLFHGGCFLFFNLSFFLTGYFFLPPQRQEYSLPIKIILALGLGSVTIGLGLFFLGAFHLFSLPAMLSLWLLLPFLAFCLRRQEILKDLKKLTREFLKEIYAQPKCLLLCLFFFYFTISHFLKAEIPFFECDTYAYLLRGLKSFVKEGGFCFLPFNARANMPFQAGLYQMFGLFFNDIHLCFVLLTSFTLLCSLVISAWIYQKSGDFFLSFLGGVIFLGLPLIRYRTGLCSNEIALAFFILLGYIFFELYLTTHQRRYLFFGAMFSGFSVGVKLLGFWAIAGYFFLFLIEFIFSQQKKVVLKSFIFFFLFAFLFASPWLIKSYLFTRNPCYPYYYKIFGGKWWNEFSDYWIFALNKNARNIPFTFKQFFLSFLNFCYPYGKISPVMLLFPCLFIRRRVKEEKFLILFYFSFYLLWWFMARLPRFGIPSIPFYLGLIITGYHTLIKNTPRAISFIFKWGGYLFFFLLLSLYSKQHLVTSVAFGSVVLENKILQQTARSGFPSWRMISYLNKTFGENVKIAGYDSYFLKGESVNFYPTTQAVFDYSKLKTPQDLEKRLIELGIDIVIFTEKPPLFSPEGGSLFAFRGEWEVFKEIHEKIAKLCLLLHDFFEYALKKYKVTKLPFGYIIHLKMH